MERQTEFINTLHSVKIFSLLKNILTNTSASNHYFNSEYRKSTIKCGTMYNKPSTWLIIPNNSISSINWRNGYFQVFVSLRIIVYLWLPISIWAVTGEYRCSKVKHELLTADSVSSFFRFSVWVEFLHTILANTPPIPPSTCYRNLGNIK